MIKKPLKIAIYSGEVPSSTFIERLIEGLAKSGNIIYLFGAKTEHVPKRKNIVNASYKQNRIYKFCHLIRYTILLSIFKPRAKRQLDLLLEKQGKKTLYLKVKYYPVLWYHPDIFHVQWAKGLQDWVWVQQFGIKLVVSFLGTHINYSPITIPEIGMMYRRFFPEVDGFHAVSKAISLKGEQYHADLSKIKVVYSGINLDLLNCPNVNKKNDRFTIISVGRTHWVKGYTYAIDAFKILKNSNFQFDYIIIGGLGDLELEYQIHELGLVNEVQLLGRMPFEKVKQMICEADLLFLPSVEEGIANVVLEAMALKTIVLSTDCGGMSEVITTGENGFLVTIRNPKAMAEAINNISLLSTEEARNIRNCAKKMILEQHSSEQMTEGMLGLYKKLMENKVS